MSTKDILLGRYASLESEAGGAGEAVAVAAEDLDVDENPIDTSETVESEMLEAAPEEAEAEQADSEADTLLDASESLESFLHAATTAGQNGGWTQGEAHAIQMGVAATLRPLQMSAFAKQVVSSESFTDGRKDLGRTISVENAITDVLKQIWTAIKNSINKLVAFVRKWYLKLVDGASRLKKRAEAIKTKAESKSGSPTEKKIKVANLGSLHVQKAVPTTALITKTLQYITKANQTLLANQQSEEYKKGLETIAESVDSILDGAAVDKNAAALMFNAAGTGSATLGQGMSSANFKGADTRLPTDKNVLASAELLGGKQFVYSTKLHDVAGVTKYYVPRVTVMDEALKKPEIDSSKEGAVLTPGDVSSFCDEIIKGVDLVIDFKSNWDKYEGANKTFISKMDSIVKKSAKGDDKAAAANARGLARVGSDFAKAGIKQSSDSISYTMSTYRAVLGYCVSSLAQYKD